MTTKVLHHSSVRWNLEPDRLDSGFRIKYGMTSGNSRSGFRTKALRNDTGLFVIPAQAGIQNQIASFWIPDKSVTK